MENIPFNPSSIMEKPRTGFNPRPMEGNRAAQQSIRRVDPTGQATESVRQQPQPQQEEQDESPEKSIFSWGKSAWVLGSAAGAGILSYWLS